MLKRGLKAVGVIFIFSLVAIAPMIGSLFILEKARAEIEPATGEVWVPTTASDSVVSEPAGVVVIWEDPKAAPAPEWGDALVQDVLIKPGDDVKTGTEIVVLDRITRVGARTAFPFDRPLGRNDRGADVGELNKFLKRQGYRFGEEDRFTYETELGVRELAKSIGAGDQRTFQPGWLVFLPLDSGRVNDINLEVGQPVGGTGEAVFTYAAAPHTAVAYGQNEYENFQATLPDPGGEERVEELPESSLPGGLTLTIAGEEFTTPDSGAEFSTEELTRLALVVKQGEIAVPALLVQDLPEDAVQIPAAAIYTSGDGATCLLARTTAGSLPRVEHVEVLDSTYGVAIISGLASDVEVWLNPPIEERRECRS